MKRTLIILSILLTFSFANSEERSNIPEKDAMQALLKEESLLTTIRAVRESRVTREMSAHQRDLRTDRAERRISSLTRETRTIRYVRLNERKYIAKLK